MTRPDRPDDWTQFDDDDPVARLIVHYFYPADLLRREYSRAEARRRRLKGYGLETERQCYLYMRLWFASLYTVIEGYREVGPREYQVDNLLGRQDMLDRLRIFRNGSFHYQPSPRKLAQLFEHPTLDALRWVEHVHDALRVCFDAYKIRVAERKLLALFGHRPPDA